MHILVLCNKDVNNLDATTGVGEIIASFAAELGRYHQVTLIDIGVRGLRLKLHRLLQKSRGEHGSSKYPYSMYVERSKTAHRITRRSSNSVDLVFQMFWRYAPFVGRPLKSYVIYTDTTGRLFLPTSDPNCDVENVQKTYRKEREVYQRAARVFTYNDRVRCSVIEDYGIDPGKVIEVGVGVGLEPSPIDQVRQYDNKRIIFIGHDQAFDIKGVPILLQAFELVKEQIEDAELVLVGIRRERGIEQAGVQVMGLVRDRQRVADLLEGASLFVLPSLRDESPGVIREAMIKKLPCVASAVGGIPEMVVDGETGRLVPPKDPECLAKVLVELLEDEDELQRMGKNGYNRALELFTWNRVVARINDHLQQIAL